jgi:PASTA domain
MTDASRPRGPALAALLAVLLVALLSAAAISDPAQAQKCTKNCLPPPEEEGGIEEPPPVEPPPSRYSVLVLNVGWDTGILPTSAPLVEETLPTYVNDIRGRVNDWYRQASGGTFPGWQVTAGGSFPIVRPAKIAPGCDSSNRDAVVQEIWEHADTAALKHGIDPSRYGTVVYVWSNVVCPFKGLSNAIGGRRVALQSPIAAVHELGHMLGLPHADSIDCEDANGQPVSLSESCSVREYGDQYDSMGLWGEGLFNAVDQNALGWMKGQVVNLSLSNASQTVSLKPLIEATQGPRAVRVVDGQTTLWFEYRVPVGIDGPLSGNDGLVRGLLIHREVHDPRGGLTASQLIRPIPGESTFNATLPVGSSWSNPLGELKVTVSGETPAEATITISSQRVTVPDLRDKTEAGAIATLKALGLDYRREAFLDSWCESIGVVHSQSPAAGTHVPPGTPVQISIGEVNHATPCR